MTAAAGAAAAAGTEADPELACALGGGNAAQHERSADDEPER